MKKLCVKCCWKWLQTNCRKNFSMRKSDSTEWLLSLHSSTVVWDGNFVWCFSLMIQRLEQRFSTARPGSALRMKSNPILQSLYTTLTSSFQQKDLIVFNIYIFEWILIFLYIWTVKTLFCISGKKFHDPQLNFHDPLPGSDLSVEKLWSRTQMTRYLRVESGLSPI